MEGMEGMEGLVVEDGGVADLERLEPLWVAVHHQHQRAMPELAPYVSDATTWEERHALYRRLYAEHDPVLLLGRDADRLVGYALGYTMPVGGTWIADTWATGPHVAEIESLSVLPEWRGRGLGSRLLEELHERLRAQGASDFVLGALAGNADALRLYERHGYRPTWLYLSRFESRDPARQRGLIGDRASPDRDVRILALPPAPGESGRAVVVRRPRQGDR